MQQGRTKTSDGVTGINAVPRSKKTADKGTSWTTAANDKVRFTI